MADDKKKQMSFTEAPQLKLGSKASTADILKMLGALANDSSPTLSDIPAPLADSAMRVVADYYEFDCDEPDTADLMRGMVVYQHLNVPANGGKRVEKILEAINSVMRMEFEIAKAGAKKALP